MEKIVVYEKSQNNIVQFINCPQGNRNILSPPPKPPWADPVIGTYLEATIWLDWFVWAGLTGAITPPSLPTSLPSFSLGSVINQLKIQSNKMSSDRLFLLDCMCVHFRNAPFSLSFWCQDEATNFWTIFFNRCGNEKFVSNYFNISNSFNSKTQFRHAYYNFEFDNLLITTNISWSWNTYKNYS